ncbi:hypothetical protein [Agromyces humi]|uniref:hypothetical protein n=1 Tax=Agromyces humi TaxID=1766800 RepID=UPI001356E213|nr:hypothetical protein [Agromyces humi]
MPYQLDKEPLEVVKAVRDWQGDVFGGATGAQIEQFKPIAHDVVATITGLKAERDVALGHIAAALTAQAAGDLDQVGKLLALANHALMVRIPVTTI